MIRNIYYIIGCLILLLVGSGCNEVEPYFPQPIPEKGNIVLRIAQSNQPVSRATVEDEDYERRLEYIDVIIFAGEAYTHNAEVETPVDYANGQYFHHERIDYADLPTDEYGTIVLRDKERKDFQTGIKYFVYLIANTSIAEATIHGVASLDELRTLTQEDESIFLTAASNVDSAPKLFLMDGAAYLKGTTEPASPTAVVLNPVDNPSRNTELSVNLRRAAAKIVATIKHGDLVKQFNQSGANYYIQNMSVRSSLLAERAAEYRVITPNLPTSGSSSYFFFSPDSIVVTAYVYSYTWNKTQAGDEVRLVVNLPLSFEENGTTTTLENNYYQIPVTKNQTLNRNTCYEVTVAVNAAGGTNPETSVPLEDITYQVHDWVDVPISVGTPEDAIPNFLSVNEEKVEMHNISADSTLYFASSKPIEVDIVNYYYDDKMGVRKTITKENEIRNAGITVSWNKTALNGEIKVTSTVPTNNTVRYITLKISNGESKDRIVTLVQYPLEYITSVLGYYSYRSDFETSYEVKGPNRHVGCSYRNGWLYSQSAGGGSFFSSKVCVSENSNNGNADIEYYSWGTYSTSPSTSSDNHTNARMYKVNITASSGTYTLGIPKIDASGFTDAKPDNMKMVSPSFMIASQLGTLGSSNTSNYTAAKDHCKNYVETYKEKYIDPSNGLEKDSVIHLHDWRLPTVEEIKIIMKYQYVPNAAMAEVLGGAGYVAADGSTVKNTYEDRTGGSGTYTRCIRDNYTIPKQDGFPYK